jgi:hypothetical protein
MGDPRVLEYLRELLHSTDSRFRAQAARVLCCLGELAPALNHADDPSPEVRLSLCEVLGLYRERSGAELLERLLNDPDAEVARNAKKALRRLEDWRRQHRQSRQKGTFRNRITRDCDLPTRKKIVQELRGVLHADGYLVFEADSFIAEGGNARCSTLDGHETESGAPPGGRRWEPASQVTAAPGGP